MYKYTHIIYMYVRFMISGQLSIMIHYQLVGNHPGILMPDTPPPRASRRVGRRW